MNFLKHSMELADNIFILVYPLLSAQYNPASKAIETYMIDLWKGFGDKIRLKSFARGHSFENNPPAEQVGNDLDISMNNLFSR